MYNDNNWNDVTGEELTGFLEQVNPIDDKYKVSAETTQVSWRALPFYESVVLVRVKDPSWSNKRLNIYYLTAEGNLFRLMGQSPPIHEVNGLAPIQVTEDNVLDYLRFFCYFVRGEEGPFLIVESIDSPDLPRDLDAQTRAVIEGTVRAASYEGRNDQGHFLCEGVVFYSNALFIAHFAVQPGGMIEMLDGDPIASDLPTRVDSPIA